MRVVGALLGAVALSVAGMVIVEPSAHASDFGFELNGTYSFLSNGEWATSNDSFHDEAAVRATWQISSTCSSPSACTGEVTSDQGWTAPLKFTVDRWIVHRELPGWAPCETGGAAFGHQTFMFYPVDDDGQVLQGSDLLGGFDRTYTDSGSCGKNLPLNILIPMRLRKVG
jgi:hypothetical protein